jgi:hypothetical protein
LFAVPPVRVSEPALPLVGGRLCRDTVDVPEVWSLVVSGALPGLGVAIDWVRWRTLEVVGAVVLGGITLSVVLALISNDSKVVLLEAAATTAAFGVACLVSLGFRRPLIFFFAQAFYGGRHSLDGAELDTDYDEFPRARSFWRTVSILTYLVQATAATIVVHTQSTATALAFNRTIPWLVFGVLFARAYLWGNRLWVRGSTSRPRTPQPSRDRTSGFKPDPGPGQNVRLRRRWCAAVGRHAWT